MRFVHPLAGRALAADVVGALGARLGKLASVDVPVAPGFVVATAAWHLTRLMGDGWGLPGAVSEQVDAALAELAGDAPVTVRAAPVLPEAAAGAPTLTRRDELEGVLRAELEAAPLPSAVVVQRRAHAVDGAPSGRGVAYTRDPVGGGVWPVGRFRWGASTIDIDIDELSRRLPAVGIALRSALARIESLDRDLRRVSFTLEDGRLWFDDAEPVPSDALGRQPSLDLEDQERHLRRQLGGRVGSDV